MLIIKTFIYTTIMSIVTANNEFGIFEAANSHYNQGNYGDSIELYEKIILDDFHSSDLYYNLGNAYYRQGLVGQSIWAYNKAILLNPRLGDAKYNLEIAMASMKDRIVLPSELLPVQIYISIKSNYTFNEWLLIGSLVVLFTVCFFVASKFFIFSNEIVQKSLFMLVILTTVLHLILIDLFFEQNTQQSGIIISNEVNAYSGPFVGENTMLFTINEGTRAKIYQKQGDWIEIAIINGDKAWIPSKTFRPL